MSNFYMGFPLATDALIVIGEVNVEGEPNDLSLYPLPYKSVGHNLWQLMVRGNSVDGVSSFDRTDYIFCTYRESLFDWSEDRRAELIERLTRDERPKLLLGMNVFRAFLPGVTFGGIPFRMGKFFCIGNPKRNNSNYENPHYYRENAAMAATALSEALRLAYQGPIAEAV